MYHRCNNKFSFGNFPLLIGIFYSCLLPSAITNDLCEDGTFCPPPNLCCEGKCCLMYESGKDFAPYYRLSLWNAWYFWFIVIFIVISCFGGCGYWRRRHMHFVSTNFHRRRCGSLTPIHEDPQGDSGNESTRPRRFIPIGHAFQNPPPYNEVTSKPDMYPLVQGGHDLKHESLAFVYATTPFFHSYLPFNTGAIGLYLSSPAESNSSSLFQSTTASNYMYPPPYSDGIFAHPSVSTPGSMMSACTPTEHSLTTHFLSSTSPPMATTPTSQQYLSEVTTPADSIASPSLIPAGFGFYRDAQLPVDPFTRQAGHILANLVADIQNMTNRMMISPATVDDERAGHSTNSPETGTTDSITSPTSTYSENDSNAPRMRSQAVQMSRISSTLPDSISMDRGFSISASITPSLNSGDATASDADRWTAAMGSSRSTANALSLPSLSSVNSPLWQPQNQVNEGTNTSPVDLPVNNNGTEEEFDAQSSFRNVAQQ